MGTFSASATAISMRSKGSLWCSGNPYRCIAWRTKKGIVVSPRSLMICSIRAAGISNLHCSFDCHLDNGNNAEKQLVCLILEQFAYPTRQTLPPVSLSGFNNGAGIQEQAHYTSPRSQASTSFCGRFQSGSMTRPFIVPNFLGPLCFEGTRSTTGLPLRVMVTCSPPSTASMSSPNLLLASRTVYVMCISFLGCQSWPSFIELL